MASATTPPVDPYRLPLNVKPLHYALTVKTDLEALQFEGHVTVDLDVLQETSTIIFNSAALEIGQISLHSEALKTEQIQIAEQSADADAERLTLKFATALPAQSKAQLRVSFKAPITDSMAGYYFSQTEIDGVKVKYALTQFEPTAARKAFPCWDEPLLKATYAVTLISREGTVNLSNMPVISEKPLSTETENEAIKTFSNLKTEGASTGWKVTTFETTPLVSSYLVAYANGPFEFIEGSYTSPLSGKVRPVRIYATKDVIHQTEFALDVNIRSLPLYEKVFDVEYPLPKLDVLVAHDFDAGAMENWGLITGRTSAYLIDPKKSDIKARKRVAQVASHEVAHQWFGNITTMSWWDNLYLNEGFATLMGELIIMEKLFPEWNASTEFVTDHLQSALQLDARRSSHPIEVPCDDAKDVNQIFDALSYSKAGSILRMLSDFVGEEKFLKGVSIYLKKNLYANTVTRNLWEGISEATQLDIPDIMNNWVLKIGFPVLTVTEEKDGIRVRQDRYLETGDVKDNENQTIWKIPLNILTTDANGKSTIDRSIVLSEREATYKIDTSRPYKINAGTSGVYRVSYPPERVALLAQQVSEKNSPFAVTDRIGLVSDAMVLAKSGISLTSAGLSVVDSLRNETEYVVWSEIASNISALFSVFWEAPEDVRENFKAFRRSLYSPTVKRLGYEKSPNDTPDIEQLRMLAVSGAAGAEDKEVVAELLSRFKNYIETGDDTRIVPELQEAIYFTAARNGGLAEWEALRKIALNPKTPTAKNHALVALAEFEVPELIEKTYKFMMTEVKTQDIMYFFVGLNANRTTRRSALQWLKANFDEVYKRFDGTFSLGYVIKIALRGFSSQEDLDDLKLFFKDKDISKYKLPLLQSYDAIEANIAWRERSNTDVVQWFEDWKRKATS